MTDCFAPAERSKVMRSVRSSGNRSTEVKAMTIFRKNKITGWRRGVELFGKPDFVFVDKRTAIFVDGCFWHGHNCRTLKPQSHGGFWRQKILKNRTRDRKVTHILKSADWAVIRIWECELDKKLSRLATKRLK